MADLTYLPYLQIKGDHELKEIYTTRAKNSCRKKKRGIICKDISG